MWGGPPKRGTLPGRKPLYQSRVRGQQQKKRHSRENLLGWSFMFFTTTTMMMACVQSHKYLCVKPGEYKRGTHTDTHIHTHVGTTGRSTLNAANRKICYSWRFNCSQSCRDTMLLHGRVATKWSGEILLKLCTKRHQPRLLCDVVTGARLPVPPFWLLIASRKRCIKFVS